MVDVPEFTFYNGVKVPALGLGCFMGAGGKEAQSEEMVKKALKNGYRHLDTATGYGNEEALSRAIRASGIPRKDIFITTKLANGDHRIVRTAFESSLKKLGVDYIDLWLIHFPQAIIDGHGAMFGTALPPDESPTFVEVWKQMEEIYAEGKVRAIGVSNFSIKNLEILLKEATVVPVTNQVELHPFYPQNELFEYCKAKNIILTAYSPLGQYNSPFYKDATLLKVAEKENATVAQVLLSWGVQRGTIVIPKTEKEERMIENIKLLKLSTESFEEVDNLHKQPGSHKPLSWHFGLAPGTAFGWTYEQLGWDLRWDEEKKWVVPVV
ncbi:hypothetical protein M422DRAFT_25433 [Sphaerobolus stellatus SS14]|nr:hypothetical protein M422DRAFT_25433 [Sphaerobolus stellatus SS14]